MSVEDRLRVGLEAEAGLAQPLTEDQLVAVVRQHRRRRTTRRGVLAVAAAAAAVVAIVVVPGRLPGGDSRDSAPATVGERGFTGRYLVELTSAPAAREGMAGRWRIVARSSGALDIEPPQSYREPTSGASYALDGNRVTTNALLSHPGCQTAAAGVYEWSRSGAGLDLAVVDDPCRARRILFSGQTWSRIP